MWMAALNLCECTCEKVRLCEDLDIICPKGKPPTELRLETRTVHLPAWANGTCCWVGTLQASLSRVPNESYSSASTKFASMFTMLFTAWKCTSANPRDWHVVHVNDPARLVYTWEEYHFGIINGKYQVYNWAHRSDSFIAYVEVEAWFLLLRATWFGGVATTLVC